MCMVQIGICGLVNAHAFLCEFVHMCVSLADSGGRLEIKTLCGTQLMIGLELKQKAEEHAEKMERGDEKKRMARAAGEEMHCLRGEGVSDCLRCSSTACV